MGNQSTSSTNNEIATPDDGGWKRWRALTNDAYARFHDKLLSCRLLFPQLASFEPVDRARATRGTFAWWWGSDSEVRETINAVNAWAVRLHEWAAWNLVIDSYESNDEKWEVLYHFVEPLAFYCMLQPSSLADRMTVAAETLVHQANRFVFPHQHDRLDQDELPLGKILRRSDRRRQLDRLGKNWTKFGVFREALNAMDGKDYQKTTHHFRNLAVHSFAPRLMVGQVTRAIRSIAPRTEMVPQPCGSYLPVEHPTQKCVQYSAQALLPLDLRITHAANLAEYQKALTAMNAFSSLIEELCDRMDAVSRERAP